MATSTARLSHDELRYIQYTHNLEDQYLPGIRSLISKDLSEPYSIYVYRYVLSNWPDLCFMVGKHETMCPGDRHYVHVEADSGCIVQALDPLDNSLIGVVICKLEEHVARSLHSPSTLRGYVAMLAVVETHRGRGIATALVLKAIEAMNFQGAHEVVLETEETNTLAMRLYERLGFLRSKKLHRYYLNGNSAYRLILPLRAINLSGDGQDLLDTESSQMREGRWPVI